MFYTKRWFYMIKSKHGAYYVVIKYKDLQGRSRQKWYRSGTNYREAVKLERKILAARDAGEPIISKTDMPTVEQFLSSWLDTAIKPPARSSGTYENYSLCSQKACTYIGRIPLNTLTPFKLSKLFQALQREEGLSVTYVRMIYRVLRTAFNTAIRWGILSENPCLRADVPSPTPSPAVALDKRQAMALLRQSEEISLSANIIIALGMLCGLREAEMCGLRWQDYDADTSELYIRHNLNIRKLDRIDHSLYEICIPHGKKYLVLDKPKTDSSNDTIIIPAYVKKLFQRQYLWYSTCRLRFGPAFQNYNFILCKETGLPIGPQSAYYTVQHVWSVYNKNHTDNPLPKIRAHDLRHTAATLLLEENVDIKYVSRQLRHSSTVITQNLYQHVTRSAASKTADVMDGLVKSNI